MIERDGQQDERREKDNECQSATRRSDAGVTRHEGVAPRPQQEDAEEGADRRGERQRCGYAQAQTHRCQVEL